MRRFVEHARRVIWAAGAVATAKLVLSVSIPLPSGEVLTDAVARGGAPLLQLYNFIGGGALAKGTPFALGIMPYLSARTMMFLARVVSPRVRALDATPAGQANKKWWTRGITVGCSVIQSLGYAKFAQNLPGVASQGGALYTAEVMVVLTSVSTLMMLFAEEATSEGHDVEPAFLPREPAATVQSDRAGDIERSPLYGARTPV